MMLAMTVCAALRCAALRCSVLCRGGGHAASQRTRTSGRWTWLLVPDRFSRGHCLFFLGAAGGSKATLFSTVVRLRLDVWPRDAEQRRQGLGRESINESHRRRGQRRRAGAMAAVAAVAAVVRSRPTRSDVAIQFTHPVHTVAGRPGVTRALQASKYPSPPASPLSSDATLPRAPLCPGRPSSHQSCFQRAAGLAGP